MSSTYSYRPPLGLDIRVKPPKETKEVDPAKRKCGWPNCENKGIHRAPKKDDPRDFQWLCLNHVREFNRSWNFFDGMADNDVQRFVEESLTGHRPTWSMGTNGTNSDKGDFHSGTGPSMNGQFRARYDPLEGPGDPFNLLSEPDKSGYTQGKHLASSLTRGQTHALETLDLPKTATRTEIKTRYKKLVKKYHPDANGGDTGTVERLRSVIRAYHVLKTANLAPED